MSLDLGDLADLATALGLLDGNGGLTTDWFAKPGSYLTSVLRNPSQRDALLTVVGDLLGGGSSTTDAAGRRWLPIVRVPGGAFAGYATITTGSTAVEIGAGIRVDVTSAGGVGCSAQVHVPLFAQPLAGGATTTLPGSAGAMVDLSVELTLPPGSATGGVGLGGAALTVAVPTHDGDRPLVTLALNGLQLPGAQAPADLVVSADTVADMDAALLQLVLGMVRAEAAALAADQRLRGLAAMLGLAADDVPDFPIDALLHTGPTALADWLARALGEAAARAAWLDGLATLVGGSVIGTGADAAVQVDLDPGRLLLGLRVVPGAAGRPRVTPTLSFEVDGAAGITLALDVDPVTLDLGSGAAAALPLLRLSARLGGAGDQALLAPPIALPGGLAVGLDELDVGFAIDASRRPVLVLQAVQAKVGAATFPTIDLTSPDALAAAAGHAVAAAAASLLTGLGDAGRAIGVLLGLADAPDGTVLPDVDAAHLLSDPLAALAEYWNHLLTGTPEQVQAVLGVLRDAIADAAQQTVPVTGDGSREHPWRVPLAGGVVLTARYPDGVLMLAAELDIAVDDLAGSAVGAGLRADLTLLELGLTGPHAGHTAFFPAASGALRFSATGGGPLALGTPPLQVRADAVGLGLSWSTGTDLSGSTAGTAGLRLQPVAEAARLAVGGTDLPLPVPGADGTLDLDADAWAAVESLAAAAAFAAGQATDSRWPAELVAALGWDVPGAPVLGPGTPSGPYLALADLVADPEQAVRGYLTEVLTLADSTTPLAALLDLLGTLLGAPVRSIGAGRPDEPWRLPLLGSGADAVADLVPALISSLGPAGPASPPATLAGWVVGWQPGDPGLALPVLVNALTGEAAVDAGLRDLITGRGDLLTGLDDVLARLVGTDGLVTLPGSSGDGGLPAGITGHRLVDLAHSTPLDRIDLSGLDLFGGGPVPATVVHMAVIAPGLPTIVPDVSADHTLDLTGAGLPPESFTVHASADPTGAWVVKIGGRADCRLASGDPDGVAGQAARLAAVLPGLIAAAGGPVLVLAHGAAGHPAVRACAGLAGVAAVVTIGTPWSAVAVDTLDRVPGAEVLRLLATLLPAHDPADSDNPDNPDLGLARSLLDLWLGLDPLADPLAELRPPGSPTVTGATPVHAVVGSLTDATVRRALTAAFVASLSERAKTRTQVPQVDPTQARAGLRLPLLPATSRGGLVCSLTLDLDLAGVAAMIDGAPAAGGAPVGPRAVVRFALGAQTGWLLGGPDPGRAPGIDRPLALRRLTAEIGLPLGLPAGTGATARMDLHDVFAFGVRTPVLTVAGGAGAVGTAVPPLPEVRALLAEVATRLDAAAATDPVLAAVRDGLAALALLSTGGASGAASSPATALGIDPVTLQRLFADPAGVAAAVLADATRTTTLAAALRTLTGDARDPATAGCTVALTFGGDPVSVTALLDLATRSMSVRAAGSTGVGWAADVALGRALTGVGGSPMTATLRIGADLPDPGSGAPAGAGSAQALALLVTASARAAVPVAARVRVALAGRVRDIAVLPAPDPAAVAGALAGAVPPLLLHTLLDALRSRLSDAAPTAAGAVDAVLDALGILAPQPPPPLGADPADPLPRRGVRLPAGLFADPGAWLRGVEPGPAALATALPALVEAVRGLLDAGSTPGRLDVAPGVGVQMVTVDGRLALTLDLDGSRFDPGGSTVGRLTLSGQAGLSLDPANPVGAGTRPDVLVTLGVPDVGSVRLGVGLRPDGTVGVTLAVHPRAGVDIPLLPAGPGLGAAVTGAALDAVVRALPTLLDTVASLAPAGTPTTVQEIAGRLLGGLGDALGLRVDSGSSRVFDPAALSTFGHDPASALAARASALVGPGLTQLKEAAQPLLGSAVTRSVDVQESALVVTVGPVALRWTPGSARILATVTAPSGVPGVESVQASVSADGSGLVGLDVAVGPAVLSAGPLTLRPSARVRAGSAPPGGRAVEVGLGAGDGRRLVARLPLGGGPGTGFSIVAVSGLPDTPVESTQPLDVALAAIAAVLDVAGSVVLAIPEVAAALDRPVLKSTTRALLTGVLLDATHTDHLDPSLLDPDQLLRRLGTLLANLLAAPGHAEVTIGGALTLAPHTKPGPDGGTVYGISVSLPEPFPLSSGDLTVSLEADGSWIHPPSGPVPSGLTLDVLHVPASGPPAVRPELTVGGVGVRLARTSGPLLATALTIESVVLSMFADVAVPDGTVHASGGARLELAGLAVGLGGGSDASNPVAGGLLAGGDGSNKPRPRFSPALAIQKHGSDATLISLTAGDGAGPWWVIIQRGFGPIYVEQVGLAVTMSAQTLASVGLLVDGRVSLLGLTATVDDLSVTYLVSTGSPMDAHAWAVDLSSLAIAADISGVTLAGALRKVPSTAGGSEYLGLLMARLAVYGISVYGGYGLVGPPEDRFASLFLFGAVNGPIGGPPAFFVTGIGGGFGINRGLTYPSDLSQFADYPFVKALDPAARPGDPMTELEQIRGYFPAQRGSFWFAAGLSFTSFALVDGVAVVAVHIGDGFELALLGLARMELPRPQVALVSVELALLARVSTRAGVILVQAQLTDNSWLLFPEIRLTGGFAFASWFGGPNRGQFVLTLGGYHPSFHRDGYPVVPRLGIAVDLYGYLSITGGAYYSLTSEAVMAGESIIASASFGPAWAHLTVGGDGIVFFDPFWFDVTVFATISAGITIDVWIGHITISATLTAKVELTGPPFHGKASFSVGPADLTIEFGDAATPPLPISWDAFVPKYLQEAAPGLAHVLGVVTGRGAVVAKGSATDGSAHGPDGSDARPFLVAAEFELTVTSLAPVRRLVTKDTTVELPTVPEISAAPMRAAATPTVALAFVGPAHLAPSDRIFALTRAAQALGAFAVGTWGPAQVQDDAKVPRGDVITAVDRVVLGASAAVAVSPRGQPEIPFRQVEVDPQHRRRPLPFVTEGSPARLTELAQTSAQLSSLVPPVPAGATTLDVAAEMLADRAGRSVADIAAWGGDRRSQPILASLGEGLGQAWRPAAVARVAPSAPPDPPPPRPPALRALLNSPVGLGAVPSVRLGPGAAPQEVAPQGVGSAVTTRGSGPVTTVSDALLGGVPGYLSMPVPGLERIDGGLLGAVPARLLRVGAPAAAGGKTVLATDAVPISRSGRSGVELTGDRGTDSATRAHLGSLGAALRGAGPAPGAPAGAADATGGMPIEGGSVTVLHLPDADRDTDPQRRPTLSALDGRARVTVVGPGGRILTDRILAAGQSMPVPAGTRIVAVHPVPEQASAIGEQGQGQDPPQVYGWDAATPLPYLGDELMLAGGAVLASSGRVPWRRALRVGTGWVTPATVIGGPTSVTTRFAAAVDVVAVALEGGAGDDDLALGLEGATRPTGTDGRPLPPGLVADGARAVAVFAVIPDPDPVTGAPVTGGVSVTVSTGPQRRLAGIAATRGGGVAPFAAAFAERGFADVVPDPVPGATDRAVLFWKEA